MAWEMEAKNGVFEGRKDGRSSRRNTNSSTVISGRSVGRKRDLKFPRHFSRLKTVPQ
jgi:hypothetical protein